MTCIYHNRDLDGYASGAVVKHFHPEATMIGWDYGNPIPELPAGEGIIMVDISFPMKDMQAVAKNSGWSLTWIDHHKSAIKEYREFVGDGETFCNAVLDETIAACEIVWKYLSPRGELPKAIEYLGMYDSWRNSDKVLWDSFIMPFQYGMRSICQSVDTFPASLLGYDCMEQVVEIIQTGKTILNYQKEMNRIKCRSSFERDFDGLRAVCLECGGNSQAFESVWNPNMHDVMLSFSYNGKFWTISLYSTKPEVDCSALAKARGGGGHKGAAGFTVKNIADILGLS